ncbi:MAG: LuxR C-terminal-related transcriptional regulator [Solirubrobacterales bacterium]
MTERHGDLVERDRLLRRLREHPDRTVLLVAPSGYGKSTLLAQLGAADARARAHVLLEHRHNDAVALATDIADALPGDQQKRAHLDAALRAPEPDVDHVVAPRLLALLTDREPFLLTLDEVEWIDSPGAGALIAALCANPPAGSRIALAGRTEPGFALGRLRSQRMLVEIGRDDLAMTRAEAEALLAAISVAPTASQLSALMERTEGWPATLYLAGLAIGESDDPRIAIDRFAGDDRIVVDYLREEFLAQLPEAQLDFLRRASVLPQLSGPLCDSVLQTRDSGEALRRLSRSNMLLIPLDRSDDWYRLHPMLRDMLLSELARADAGARAELNLRAATWWSERGETERAIEHAVASGLAARAGELLWLAVPEMMPRGRRSSFSRWLEHFDRQTIESDPGLALTAVWVDLTMGLGASAQWLNSVTRRLLDAQPDSMLKLTMDCGVTLADAVLGRDGIQTMRNDVAEAEALLGNGTPWSVLCALIDGSALLFTGDPQLGRQRLRDGARLGSQLAPNLQVICQAQLALLAHIDGDHRVAEREIALGRMQIERTGLTEYPMLALAYAISALIRTHSGDVDGAVADGGKARKLLARIDQFAPWYEAETYFVLARAETKIGNAAAAGELLDESERHLAEITDAPQLAGWIAEARASAGRQNGQVDGHFTPAELRVLGHLPTHKSLPQIAAELEVSTNTVKTHVRSIYGKLEASSREQAVQRAREAGLFDPASDAVAAN